MGQPAPDGSGDDGDDTVVLVLVVVKEADVISDDDEDEDESEEIEDLVDFVENEMVDGGVDEEVKGVVEVNEGSIPVVADKEAEGDGNETVELMLGKLLLPLLLTTASSST